MTGDIKMASEFPIAFAKDFTLRDFLKFIDVLNHHGFKAEFIPAKNLSEHSSFEIGVSSKEEHQHSGPDRHGCCE